jgi:hypothetical protein
LYRLYTENVLAKNQLNIIRHVVELLEHQIKFEDAYCQRQLILREEELQLLEALVSVYDWLLDYQSGFQHPEMQCAGLSPSIQNYTVNLRDGQ